jgi:nucleoside-diphosphate-sugar epimerase
MDKISVFGPGFIGGRFCEMYPEDTIKIARDDYVPKSNEVLYLISTTDNYNVFTNPCLDIETNLILLMLVLQNCNQNVTFNYISSWFVYGNAPLPIKEDAYCNPKGLYAITKRCAEQLLISYCETFKINYRIFRLGNVIGEGDKKASKKKNALQYLMKEIIEGRDINLYGGGTFTRDYMYVDDVCDAIHLCMEKAPLNDIMHIASGIPSRFVDLIEYTKVITDSKSKLNHMEPTDFHKIVQTKDNYLDVSKLDALGFIPKYTTLDALDKIIEYMQENKEC